MVARQGLKNDGNNTQLRDLTKEMDDQLLTVTLLFWTPLVFQDNKLPAKSVKYVHKSKEKLLISSFSNNKVKLDMQFIC